MGYKENFRTGSFRGVEFKIDSSTKGLGRRSVLHEYPNREKPSTEDMGRAAKTYEVEGYIIGDDYQEQRDLLEAALDTPGPGELIHPFYGSLIVQVGPVSFSESNKEGGILYFTAKFTEAGDNSFPRSVNDRNVILEDKANDALTEASKELEDTFSIEDLPAYAIETAQQAIENVSEIFDTATATLSDVANTASEVAFSIRNLVADTNDLLQSPSVLAQRLLDSFSLLEESISLGGDRESALGGFTSFGDNDVEIQDNTPSREREKENQRQLNNFIKRVAIIKLANNAKDAGYESIDKAESSRQSIVDGIEIQIKESASDDFIQAMYDLSAALVDAVPNTDTDIPSVKNIELDQTVSTLELTYELFESNDNEQDIIDRNSVSNPCFLKAGEVLEVIGGQ